MTRLLALFAGNPLIFVGVVIAIFLFGATTGWTAAWKIQGIRITAEEQKFTDYKQTQTGLIQKEKDRAAIQREKAGNDYAHLSWILDEQINKGVVLERCIAAGKCGVRVLKQSTCTAGIRLPPAVRADEASTDTVFARPEAAAEDPVVNDCAITTLMLNSLQADIENQPGFKE